MADITTIQIRRGTLAQWNDANPILAEGEPALVTDSGRVKYGDGRTTFSLLPYADTKIPTATTSAAGLMSANHLATLNTAVNNIKAANEAIEKAKATASEANATAGTLEIEYNEHYYFPLSVLAITLPTLIEIKADGVSEEEILQGFEVEGAIAWRCSSAYIPMTNIYHTHYIKPTKEMLGGTLYIYVLPEAINITATTLVFKQLQVIGYARDVSIKGGDWRLVEVRGQSSIYLASPFFCSSLIDCIYQAIKTTTTRVYTQPHLLETYREATAHVNDNQIDILR